MPRTRYMIKSIMLFPDGPQRTLYQILMRPTAIEGSPEYVYYESQHEDTKPPYQEGAIIEVDERLVARSE